MLQSEYVVFSNRLLTSSYGEQLGVMAVAYVILGPSRAGSISHLALRFSFSNLCFCGEHCPLVQDCIQTPFNYIFN